MNKKLISLLVAICLVIGLLPSVTIPHAHATDTAKTTQIHILGTNFTLTEGMEPVYRLRNEYDLYDSTGETLLGKGGVLGSECTATDDWAIKWEWPTGEVPTITLRNATFGNSVNGVQGYKKDNPTAPKLLQNGFVANGPSYTGLKLILDGENFFDGAAVYSCFMKGNLTDVTIEGVNNGKLNAYLIGDTHLNGFVTVSKHDTDPASLTIKNVTIDVAASTQKFGVIQCTSLPIVIENSDITINNRKSAPPSAIRADGTGSSLTVTNSTLDVDGGNAGGDDVILVNGDITFNNSNVTVEANYMASGISTTGTVKVNGGVLNSKGGYAGYGIEGAVELNSGEMWLYGTKAMNGAPTLAEGTTGTCGSKNYDGWGAYGTRADDYNRAYVHLKVPSVACAHDWEPATCTEPKTCKLCGEKDGEALGHSGGEATCEQLATCGVCGVTYGELADCKPNAEGTACSVCGRSFAAGDPLPYSMTVKVPIQTTHIALTVNKYEEAVYTRNYEYDSTDTAGNAFKATVQTTDGADENNWNVKFVWHAGDRAPTLYIKDMIVDEYNEEKALWESSLSTPIEFVNNTAVDGEKAKLVITGDKSVFKAFWGVRYAIPLEIESEGNAKLEAYTKNTCITCWGTTSAPLTINANLDLNFRDQYGDAHGVIQTFCNDLVINGGDITAHLDSTANAYFAINVRCAGGNCTDCGDVIINGGNITMSKVKNGHGMISSAKGDVIINRGSVTVTKAIGHALYAPNGSVKINGGVVDLRTGDYGVCCINAKISIDINGGTGRIRGVNGAFNKEPALATGINMFAGASSSTATPDGLYTSKFVWFGVGDMPVCNHETWLPADCSTPETCADCGETRGKAKPHEGGTATCEDKPVCVNCGKEYGSPLGHTGGEATCQKKAVCEICNNEYGELGVCVLNAEGTACKNCGKVFAAGDTLPYSLTVKVPIQTTHIALTVNKYEEAVYTRNYEYDSTDTAGNAFKATVQTTAGADENNWNVKFVWHLGDDAPTLYIKDMIVDEYNEEKALWESSLSTPIEFVNNTAVDGEKAKLVITGDKSVFKAAWAVRYAIPLEIESEGDAKLEAYTKNTCITCWPEKAPLTINANLDLNFRDQYGQAHGVIQTLCSDLVINGGDITAHLDSTANAYFAIVARCAGGNCTDCGDVIINGGNITMSKVKGGHGMIYSEKGNVTINGGAVTVTDAQGHVIAANKAVTINGGVLDLRTGAYGTAYGIHAASIAINGGTGQIRAYKGALNNAPVLGTGMSFYAGATSATAKADGSHTSKFAWFGVGEMPVCNHETWLPADCTTPKTCAACGETEGKALGHKGGTATCQDKPVCEVCNKPYGSPLGHTGGEATCQKKPVCDNCHQEYGELLVCDLDDKGLCKVCGTQYTTNGPLPHNMSMTVNVAGVTTSIDLKITKFDEAVYTRNYEYDSVDSAGNAFKATVQTTDGADENNWNVKYIWHLGDKAPTLYIKDMIVDEYNEDTSLWENDISTPIALTNNTKVAGEEAKLVITGSKSVFKALWGVRYAIPLEIKSEGDAMLEAFTKNTCITSWPEKAPLTINANLDLNYAEQYGEAHGVIQTLCSDLVINGGNISGNLKATGRQGGTIYAYCIDKDKCTGCGNIIINGGNIKATCSVGTAHPNGTIRSDKGTITINGGNLDIASKQAVALYSGKGIEINGGVVNLSSPWYVLNAGSKAAPVNVTFNGGTTTIIGQYCIYKDGGVIPVIAEGMYAYAGAGPRSAQEFDGTQKKLFTKPWMLITDDESKKIVIEEDDEELEEDIIDPTEAPTESTDATETTATAPSVAPDAPDATDATGATTATDATEATTPDDGYYDYGITPNLMITEGIPEYVPDGLYEAGFDTADMIRDTLVEMIWAVDDYSDMFAFFDITLMFFDGEEWVEASEEHYPEEGYITAMLPYPEGTDMDTYFTAVHMFGSDAFGMTAGDVELLAPINTEDGILVELIGLSPVAIAWEGTGEYEDNYVTGDTSIGMYVGLMVVALLGMATTVVYSNKKRKTY